MISKISTCQLMLVAAAYCAQGVHGHHPNYRPATDHPNYDKDVRFKALRATALRAEAERAEDTATIMNWRGLSANWMGQRRGGMGNPCTAPTKGLDNYFKTCVNNGTAVPYVDVEKATRKNEHGHGWTNQMYQDTLLTRCMKAPNEEDSMYSTRVTGLVTAKEAVKIVNGVVHKQSSTNHAIDVLKQIDDWHTAKNGEYGAPKGLECTITHSVHPPKSGADAGGNIFSSTGAGTTFPHANLRCEGKDDQPSFADEGEGAGSQKMNEWLSNNMPELKTKDELALYGFAKVKNESFVLKSPIGFWPIIPVYVGEKYHKNVRGGMYIERHNPIHLWAPTSNHAATGGGYIFTAIPTGAELKWHKGYKGSKGDADSLKAPKEGKYKLAKIKVAFGESLVSHPFAYHCDATLSHGVWLTSFSFGPGPEGMKDPGAAASGFQPLNSISKDGKLPHEREGSSGGLSFL